MKTIACIVLTIISVSNCFAQPNRFDVKHLPQKNDTLQQSETAVVIPTPAGDYLMAVTGGGYYNLNPSALNYSYFYIAKISPTGIITYIKSYADTLMQMFGMRAIIKTHSNSYVVVGSRDYNSGKKNAALFKINGNGDTLFTKEFVLGDESHFYSATETYDNALLLVGQNQPLAGSGNLTQSLIIKTDSMGNELWRHQYGGANNYDGANSVVTTKDSGALVLSVMQQIGSPNPHILLYKIDSLGGVEWQQNYATATAERCEKIIATTDGNYLMIGTQLMASGDNQGLLIKIDSAGTVLWQKTPGLVNREEAFSSVTETTNNNFVVVGSSTTNNPTSSIQFIWKFNSIGDSLWQRNLYVDSNYIFATMYSIAHAQDGGLFLNGTFQQHYNTPPYGNHVNTWLVKTDSLGCYIAGCNTVGLSTTRTTALGSLVIQPNIFSTEAMVTYTVPNNEEALYLDIYNITGTLVKTYTLPANATTYKLSAQELNQGVKLAVLRTNTTHISTQKIVIIN
ncbi:MAG: hypothetical protein ABL940_00700 [Bacteroidia bacterium]